MAPRKPVVRMRNVVIELPEEMMLRLVRRAKDARLTTHEMAETVLRDWLES